MSKRLGRYLIPQKNNQYKPHIFREVGVVLVLLLVVATLLVAGSVTVLVRHSGLLSAVYPSVLVDLANEARVSNGQTALTVNDKLTQAAQLKANDMAEKGYFAHTSPEGVSPWYWIGLSKYQFLYAGENLAVDFTESANINTAWLNSPSHAENILSPHFTEVGIATAEGVYNGEKTIFVAQMFGTPIPQVTTKVAGAHVEPVDNSEKVFTAVKNSEVDIVAQTNSEDELFIAVENTNTPKQVVEDKGEVKPSAASGYETYAHWYDFLVVEPHKATEYALYVATGVIIVLLFLMVFVNIRTQYPRNLAYGCVLLVLLILAIYLNKAGIINEIVSRYFL